MADFETVKGYISELGYQVVKEDKENEIVVISDVNNGINNFIIDCEEPIVILEQLIIKLKDKNDPKVLSTFLKMNRNLVHGAFVLDESGEMLLYRDTLQLATLDYIELKSSIDSLILALKEYINVFVEYKK